MTTTIPLSKEKIIYPESDGTPMGESDKHRDAMTALIETLKDHFRQQVDVYVSGNLFVYYEQGEPSAVFAPDAFVVFGVSKEQRRTYKLWEEGNNSPNVIFEVSSLSTWLEDEGRKKVISRHLGVQEYFLFDPNQEYLDVPLRGFELEDGDYRAMSFDDQGKLYSRELDLYIFVENRRLRLQNAKTGEILLHPDEVLEAHRQEARARQTAEVKAQQEARARQAAEVKAKQEARARQAAEAELTRLQEELRKLRGQ